MKAYLAIETNSKDKNAANMVNRELISGTTVFHNDYETLLNIDACLCKWVYMGMLNINPELYPEVWIALPVILAYDNKGRFLVVEHEALITYSKVIDFDDLP